MRRFPVRLAGAALAALLLMPSAVSAQGPTTLRGTVTQAETGTPLPGVQIVVKGTTIGTITDGAGNYILNVPPSASALVFSYIGYRTVEVEITGEVHNVSLEVEAIGLEGLVVTAMGMTRERREVGYAIQTVSGEELSAVPDLNVVSTLSGKAAGVQVTNAGPLGGSARIVIRGNSSISGNNQPLFVVDGIPIDNSADDNSGFGGGSGGGIDYGNAAADIDPANIESVTVLKGPNAAAIYGSRAANGAVVITTRTGQRAGSGLGIIATSQVLFDQPLRLPQYQNEYGQGFNGKFRYVDGRGGGDNDHADESWGPKLDGRPIDQFHGEQQPWVASPNNVRDFFDLGKTYVNNVAVERSGERSHFRLGITRTDADGMGPAALLDRTSFALAGGVQVTDRLDVEAGGTYISRQGENLPGTGYSATNYIQQFTWFGRQVDLSRIKDYKAEDGTQRTWNSNYHDNPYWIAYENWNRDDRDRLIGRVSARYQLTDWLSAMFRTGRDWYEHNRKRVRAKDGINFPDGGFSEEVIERSETNTHFLLTATRPLTSDLTVTATAGAERRDQNYRLHGVNVATLVVPNIYSLQNAGSTPAVRDLVERKRVNSVLGTLNLNFRGYLNVDLTGRNDWSSTLPEEHNSFFYPSVSGAFVFTDAFGMQSSFLSSGKVRAGWTRVGNDTDPYQLAATFQSTAAWDGLPRFTVPGALPNADLKPEEKTAWEVGADLGFFNERLGFVVTYYDERTRNQILGVDISPTSGYTSQTVNAGEIRNWGYEMLLRAVPVRLDNGFTWETTVNFALPKNEVVDLYGGEDGIDAYRLGGAYWSLEVQARRGRPYGVLWGNGFLRHEGKIVVDENGVPLIDPVMRELGNYNPDWLAGIRNRFSYRDFDLSFLLDTKQGGQLFSTTIWFNRYAGVAEETLEGRENDFCDPGIVVPGVKVVGTNADGSSQYAENDIKVCPQDYFHAVFGNHERGIVDASFIKLREVTLGWNVPQSITGRLGFSNARLALIGRNLWLHTPDENPHVDPETAFDTGNRQGLEFGQYPTARQLGFSVTIRP